MTAITYAAIYIVGGIVIGLTIGNVILSVVQRIMEVAGAL